MQSVEKKCMLNSYNAEKSRVDRIITPRICIVGVAEC